MVPHHDISHYKSHDMRSHLTSDETTYYIIVTSMRWYYVMLLSRVSNQRVVCFGKYVIEGWILRVCMVELSCVVHTTSIVYPWHPQRLLFGEFTHSPWLEFTYQFDFYFRSCEVHLNLLLFSGLLRYKVDFQSMEYDGLDDLDFFDDEEDIF